MIVYIIIWIFIDFGLKFIGGIYSCVALFCTCIYIFTRQNEFEGG